MPGVVCLGALGSCTDGPVATDDGTARYAIWIRDPSCSQFCVQGSEHAVEIQVGRSTAADLIPTAGALLEIEADDALELSQTALRAGPDGIVHATVRMQEVTDRASLRVRLAELPNGATAADSVVDRSIEFGIVAEPPVIHISPDSLVFSEPGCEGEVTWSLRSGDRVIPFTGNHSIVGKAVASMNAPGMHIVRALREGRTRLDVWQQDGAGRISASMPIVVLGPFTPRSFFGGDFGLALGNSLPWHASVQGMCKVEAVSEGLEYRSLDPDVVVTDADAGRTIGVALGRARVVRRWQALEDTITVVTWDHRPIPLDTTIAPGAEFEYGGESARGDSTYRAMGFDYNYYWQLTSSNPQVVSVRFNWPNYRVIAQGVSPGTATMTAVLVDRHGHAWGPVRTARVVVAAPN